MTSVQEHGAASAVGGRWRLGSIVHTTLRPLVHPAVHAQNHRSTPNTQIKRNQYNTGMTLYPIPKWASLSPFSPSPTKLVIVIAYLIVSTSQESDDLLEQSVCPKNTPKTLSLKWQMKELERQILASQEEELACGLELSSLFNIVNDWQLSFLKIIFSLIWSLGLLDLVVLMIYICINNVNIFYTVCVGFWFYFRLTC